MWINDFNTGIRFSFRQSVQHSLKLAAISAIFLFNPSSQAASKKPNVIIVITDDQGYGDLGCHGNPILKTPHIDRFYQQSVRLTNYHVDPTCSPSRSALMTGRHSNRVGVWHTVQGRSLLRAREKTIGDVFKENGYATGFFGKWHLGDSFPYRPEDRGFSHVVMHGGGGIGQTPDFWGNDYFNDTYYVNGTWRKFDGYCTDIWFGEAKKFIQHNKAKGRPFFAYLSLNAPHSPKRAPTQYIDLYKDHPGLKNHREAVPFFAMIANIDDNFGALMKFLKSEGLEKNTILVFTTDNGSAGGASVWSAGMKGSKGSAYEGGHRVPWLMRWPDGKLQGGRDVDQLTAHMDILPTMIDMLELNTAPVQYDGTSLKEILYGNHEKLRNRTLIVESQRIKDPEKWRRCSVMDDRWRLVEGKLFDLKKDSAQGNDVSQQFPEVVEKLRAQYEKFWTDVSREHDLFSRLVMGAPEQNPTTFTAMDLVTEKGIPAWNQSLIMKGKSNDAPWMVKVHSKGRYEISIRRWPAESDWQINFKRQKNDTAQWATAFLEIAGKKQTKQIPPHAVEVTFSIDLPQGATTLRTGFISRDKKRASANYAYVLNTTIDQTKTKGWQTRKGLGLPLVDWDTQQDYPKICDEFGKKPKKKRGRK